MLVVLTETYCNKVNTLIGGSQMSDVKETRLLCIVSDVWLAEVSRAVSVLFGCGPEVTSPNLHSGI